MKCQILFSRKNKKNISKDCPLKFLPSMHLYVHLSLLIMTNPYQTGEVLLFVWSKMAVETNLGSILPVADRTREV